MGTDAIRFFEVSRRMPLTTLPVRTSSVQLGDARVLLSPASALDAEQLRAAGEITDIVSPTLFHTDGMPAAAKAHPRARLWGPAGIREKLPALQWHGILGADLWPWERELAHVALGGMPSLNESAFVHRPSRTLLVADLVFNIEEPRGFGSWLIFTAFGTYRRFGVSRLFLAAVKDRAAFQVSVDQLAALDFDRVVPAHGSIVANGGRELLFAALRKRGYSPTQAAAGSAAVGSR